MAIAIEDRVTNLEEMMAQLIGTVAQTSQDLRDFKDEMRGFKDGVEEFKVEMLDFKNEMRDFKDEMLDFKDEMRDFKDEMRDFKDEMRDFKDEMRDFKDEMRGFKDGVEEFKDEMRGFKDGVEEFKVETQDFIIDWRKQWGELSNKMGTMAEDLVAPSISRVVREVVDCPANNVDSAVRVKRTNHQGQQREFDVIATCGDYLFINETKSKLIPEHIKTFLEEVLPVVHDFFPEHANKKVVGIVASLYVDASLVQYGEKQGLVVLGFGEDVMDVLNSPEFVPKTW